MTLSGKIGNIRIESEIARGGMGEVYVGYDEKLQRRVALKAMRRDRVWTETHRAWFLREARILSRLDHPNICRIYDFLDDEDCDVLVLEFIEGHTLTRVVRRDELDFRRRIEIAIEVAGVLVAAHDEGLIHRDLKPDNVMITTEGHTKLLDFGVARTVDDPLAPEAEPLRQTLAEDSGASADQLVTLPGQFPGTPQYMSPEQARGERLSAASDMYSFGLLLRFLFSGRLPYDIQLPPVEMLKAAAAGTVVPVELPQSDLASLIHRLNSVRPAARPTAVDTLARLEWIRDQSRRRLRRFVVAAALVTLTATTMLATVQSIKSERNASAAERHARLARSRQLVAQADVALKGDLDRALLLALEAQRHADTLEARTMLLTALQAQPRLAVALPNPETSIHDLTWHPDGSRLALATNHGIVLWDVGSRRKLGEIPGARMLKADWSPDGRFLATVGDGEPVRIWDVGAEHLREVGRPFNGHEGKVWSVAWHPDGKNFVTSSEDRTVRFWNAATGEPTWTPIVTREESYVATWNPAGTILAYLEDEATMRLWDVATGTPRGEPIAPDCWIWDVAWSPDGHTLALACDERIVVMPAADTSDRRFFRGHTGTIHTVSWSPDGHTLASGAGDKTVRLWDVDTGESLGLVLGSHRDEVRSVSWSPDGRTLASAGLGGKVLIWDLASEHLRGGLLTGHDNWVMSLAWSPDGRILASTGVDKSIRLWDPRAVRPQRGTFDDHANAVWSLAWSSRGQLISASEDRTIRVRDRVPSGGSKGGKDGPSGNTLYELRGHSDEVMCIALSPDHRTLASVSKDGTIRLWDLVTGETRGRALTGHEGSVLAAAWTPDGKQLITAGEDRGIRLWDPDTRRLVMPPFIGHTHRILSLAVAPDGGTLASASRDGTVRLWDLATGEPRGQPLAAHPSGVRSVAWSADGELLASAGREGRIGIWDAATGTALALLNRHTGAVLSVLWHPTERFLASASADQTVALHDLAGDAEAWRERACQRAQRNLSLEEWESFVGTEVDYHETCPRPGGFAAAGGGPHSAQVAP